MNLELECPICKKRRLYKTKQGYNKARLFNKPCKSCSNSLQAGGLGYILKDNKKLCSYCKEYKELNEFNKTSSGQFYSRCKNCQSIYNTEYHSNKYRFDKYNISKEEFNSLISNQSFKCAICTDPIDSSCHIDHDHKSNKVRGLLCEKCNKGLGQFRDNIEILEKAINYLKNQI